MRTATIDGVPYVLHSEESVLDPLANGCLSQELNPLAGPAQPWLTNITDETDPTTISQFRLEINELESCPAQLLSGVNASTHYHDVDDPDDTTFAMVSMWHAGVRIVDVRDPARPTEVAYFNPGQWATTDGSEILDKAWGHVRYVPETGHLWFATETGGFWVVELQPQVRADLGLPPLPSTASGATLAEVKERVATSDIKFPNVLYCTLNAVTSALP